MGKTVSVKVTPRGVLVPHSLVSDWDEVEIEQRVNALIITPRGHEREKLHAEIRQEMKAAGLVEDLTWELPPVVSAGERARLAKKLGQGGPLSELIMHERDACL